MRRRLTAALLLACLAAAVPAVAGGAPAASPIHTGPPSGPVPPDFFGIAPQTTLTPADTSRMRTGGIATVRLPLPWNAIQPTAGGGFDWAGTDAAVEVAARGGLRVLPFLYGTPRWLARQPTTLPIDNARERSAWVAFVTAAVKRYGPGGSFWAEHGPGVQYVDGHPQPDPDPYLADLERGEFPLLRLPRLSDPLRAPPATHPPRDQERRPSRQGRPRRPLRRPDREWRSRMPAADFLDALYRVPGIKADFDGVALHPYAVDTATLTDLVEGIHDVTVENHDRVGLYVTEMGWGSQNDFNQVAFEQGIGGQVRQLRAAYTYLIDNQRRLNLKQVYWFSWKDVQGACNFCDSVGLFRAGQRFHAKPAWHAFVALARASLRR